ncbi:MAG: hypothetical protein EON58_18260, partial [Alphaproteobacteria bacterium]
FRRFDMRPADTHNRIASYTGLDLFGADISSMRVGDAGECAQSCLVMNSQCKAFTFNSNPNGVVSGLKEVETFAPARIVSLD